MEQPLFFLHMPKAAGTSLTHLIEPKFAGGGVCPFYYPRQLIGVSQAEFDGYRYFRGHLHYEIMRRILGKDANFITMLRHPIARFTSHYRFWQANPHLIRGAQRNIDRFKAMSLSDFATAEAFGPTLTAQNEQIRLIAASFETEDLEEWYTLFDKSKRRYAPDVELGKERLAAFATVGLTERFSESLLLLSYHLGWEPMVQYKTLNVTQKRGGNGRIDEKTESEIVEANRADLDLYRYGKVLFEAQLAEMTETLLSRYGTVAQAQSKRPLMIDALYELAQKNYTQTMSHSRKWWRLGE